MRWIKGPEHVKTDSYFRAFDLNDEYCPVSEFWLDKFGNELECMSASVA